MSPWLVFPTFTMPVRNSCPQDTFIRCFALQTISLSPTPVSAAPLLSHLYIFTKATSQATRHWSCTYSPRPPAKLPDIGLCTYSPRPPAKLPDIGLVHIHQGHQPSYPTLVLYIFTKATSQATRHWSCTYSPRPPAKLPDIGLVHIHQGHQPCYPTLVLYIFTKATSQATRHWSC